MNALIDAAARGLSPRQRPMTSPIGWRDQVSAIIERMENGRRQLLVQGIKVNGCGRFVFVETDPEKGAHIARFPDFSMFGFKEREREFALLTIHKEDVHKVPRQDIE